MDVERTMEFILKHQAKSEAQMGAMQTQMGAMQTQMGAMQTQMAAMQKQMAGMQKLVRTGMRILAKQGENIGKLAAADKEVKAELRELAKAQRTTETKLQSFIDSMRRGGNGRHLRN